jgi:hypothetical protein
MNLPYQAKPVDRRFAHWKVSPDLTSELLSIAGVGAGRCAMEGISQSGACGCVNTCIGTCVSNDHCIGFCV